MASITDVQALCTALTDETTKGSITPSRLGNLLTNIVTLISDEVERAAAKATTLEGYGITDAAKKATTLEGYGITDGAKKATTLAGYGITDGVQKVVGKGLSTHDFKEAMKSYEVWATVPQDNYRYILGQVSSLVLSTNGMSPDECKHGTTIYFQAPTSAPTSIIFKDETIWSGDAPEVEAGGYYCICIFEGVYTLINLTYQSI